MRTEESRGGTMTPPYGWLVTRDKKFYNYTQKIFTFTILLVYTLLEPRFRNSFFLR